MNATASSFDLATPVSTTNGRAWLPWLAMLCVGGGFFVADHDMTTSLADAFTQTAEEMEERAGGGELERRLVFPLMGCVGLVLLVLPARDELRLDPLLLVPMLAYLGWCAVSVLWSIDTGMTLRRVVVLSCVVLAAAGVGRQATSRDLMLIGIVVPAVFLAIGVFSEIRLGTFRPWAGEYRFSGTQHPNTTGVNLACMCISSACLLQVTRRGRWLLAATFAAGFLFLLLTKSRTSAAGVLVALAAYWTVTTPLRWKVVLGASGLWCLAAGALALMLWGVDVESAVAEKALMGREEQAESLTGRLPIWTTIAPFIADRPLTGYGYESFWTAEHIAHVSGELHWGIREAHSMFLDTILSVGFVGLLPAVLTVFVAMWRCQQRYGRAGDPVYGMLLALLVFGFINSFTESAMLMVNYYTFVGGCGVTALALRDVRGFTPREVSTETHAEPAWLLAHRTTPGFREPDAVTATATATLEGPEAATRETSTPDVTIVVCTYNRAERLPTALGSLGRLQLGDRTGEILVIDNNSTDDTAAVVERIASESPIPMRCVRECEQGIVPARNRGIAEARGRWIAYFDDDQIAEPDWIDELLTMADAKGVRCVGGRVVLQLPEGESRALAPEVRMLLGESVGLTEPRSYNRRVTPGCGNLIVRRDVFDEVGGFDPAYANRGEDTDLYLRMNSAGVEAWYTPSAVVHHVIPPERLSDEFLLRLSRVMAEGMAEDERLTWGPWLYPFVWCARVGQAAGVIAPRWLWAKLCGDGERALGARCRLAIALDALGNGLRLMTTGAGE